MNAYAGSDGDRGADCGAAGADGGDVMPTTLHSIATEYAARTSRTGIRGNVMWESHRDRMTHAFMLMVADILEQSQMEEGPLALAASRRQVEILELMPKHDREQFMKLWNAYQESQRAFHEAAREDIPALLAEVERVTAERDTARAGVERLTEDIDTLHRECARLYEIEDEHRKCPL